jgi:serine/threonine protein kinase
MSGLVNSKAGNFDISIFGPRSGEYAHAVQSLLCGELPKGWEWVNSSSNTRIARRLKPFTAYYKEFLSRSCFERFKSLFRGSRCHRARVQGELLRQKGFHSPAILCWGKQGRRRFMVTEGIKALGLFDFITKNWTTPLAGEQLHSKRKIIEKLGEEIGRLHKEGICHGDLRLNNILVQQIEDGIYFYFIDNERNRCFTKIPKRLIEKNLVQVNMIFPPHVTLQDSLRFFRAYSRTYPRFSPEEERILVQKVHRRTLRRLAAVAAKRKRVTRTPNWES